MAKDMASHGRMVLRVRPTERTKRSASLSIVDEEEKRPKSVKKPKTKQKKKSGNLMPRNPRNHQRLSSSSSKLGLTYLYGGFSKEFQEKNPGVKSMRDVGKACGEKWKTMTYEEKVQYYDVATEKRAEFDRAMAEYIKRKESGEDQETDEDSEFDG
ncbi:hypothetical protein FNV43_RR07268 [Rhamnella rubrinervis]|uniref:HMG box domain-containing protein n=1 Tax=Rhamnella rubrinervis TaxID=2594499 RepID=A0A8K0MM15_9ROSA|nr:hypothetical protein FNV43_RR07268 [Rhamnella rubrinervis]